MSGVNEILLIGAIVLAILLLPRLKKQKPPATLRGPKLIISGRTRLGIAASVFWPLLMSAVFQPWKKEVVWFLYVGVCPVLIGWVLYWVWRGFWRHHG